ncbi:TrbC/VirB2 family protein [Deinococcus marmoris]|uniref:TrbC/VirB2 family protein n=1 Tax=Deinococcus marmoris TaxID=249408 RepID=UPI00138DD843|nr:TrbC/VirB2 family protein [Deinococcus marmoris]
MALLALALAFAASFGAAQDFSRITTLVCGVVTQLTAPVLLGAAGTVVVVMFGWNKLMGEQNAFQSLKNGVIGGIIILAAGTIATALFGSGCA